MLHFLPTFFVSFWIYGIGVNNQRGSTGVGGSGRATPLFFFSLFNYSSSMFLFSHDKLRFVHNQPNLSTYLPLHNYIL